MKRLFYILILSAINYSLTGQTEVLSRSEIYPASPARTDYNTDLASHWFWSGYLKAFGKPEIKTDTAIEEGYRLLHRGEYISVVEIIKYQNNYVVTIDSSSWSDRFIYRKRDTLNRGLYLKDLTDYCSTLYDKVRIPEKESFVGAISDERDNWAFEWKYRNEYSMVEGIEVSDEFARIIQMLMEIGGLRGYEVFLVKKEATGSISYP